MSTQEPFDPLIRFAEIERLVSKIYFRFSHLFFPQPEVERLLVGDGQRGRTARVHLERVSGGD